MDIDDDAEETIGKKSKHGGEFGEEYRAKVNQMEKIKWTPHHILRLL